jgi:hypothetical protein
MPNPNDAPEKSANHLEIDQYEELKGVKDDSGIPKHPQERADYYQTKFSESSRGAQELLNQNQNLNKEIEELKTPKFTPDELSKMIPGYDQLAPEQQKAIFDSWSNTQRDLDTLKNQVAVLTDKQVFEDGFKNLVKTEQYSVLRKHKADFKDFAYSDEYRGIDDLAIITDSYIMKKKLYAPTDKDPKDPNEPADRPGLEATKSGYKPTPAVGGMTAAQAAELRKTNPQKYNALAATGKLKIID